MKNQAAKRVGAGGNRGPSERRVLLVHERSTTNTERYQEVPDGEREVYKHVYVDRATLRQLAKAVGVDEKIPQVIELTLRVVDPKELQEGRYGG